MLDANKPSAKRRIKIRRDGRVADNKNNFGAEDFCGLAPSALRDTVGGIEFGATRPIFWR